MVFPVIKAGFEADYFYICCQLVFLVNWNCQLVTYGYFYDNRDNNDNGKNVRNGCFRCLCCRLNSMLTLRPARQTDKIVSAGT